MLCVQPVTPLKVVPANSALRLRAILDFEDSESGSKRTAGDEWLFEGPGKKSVVFIYLFIFSYSLSFAGNLGQLKHLHEQRYKYLLVHAAFWCVQAMVWMPLCGFFNERTDAEAPKLNLGEKIYKECSEQS